ncbi:DNA-directed RNA polymerase III, subunit Rpc31 [Leucosporidium creatinivorum]|uniref:DNA-directed RNA polymerase III subunit n=1 Tax=Leucosporidium creatinivorum TaxID=106004 RepID=A0A1Y2EL08_9BASI|nr:DNA-directed RNA polymerase III, subunit Rpc31 [Leucosporidium creatinivorum]
MAARGGRGGGRGGRGGGASGKPQMPIGHLAYADIIAYSGEGTDVLYPPADVPDTEYPTEREARIAARYNTMTSEMKFTPFWIDAPVKASTDIERYSDRFKLGQSSADGTPTATLASLHDDRNYDRGLLPNAAFEAILAKEKKKRGRDGASRTRRQKIKVSDALAGDDENAEGKEGDQSGSEMEEDPDMLEEEEEEEDNDYEDNYFDNGEDDGGDGDALGGGGDEDGGTFD